MSLKMPTAKVAGAKAVSARNANSFAGQSVTMRSPVAAPTRVNLQVRAASLQEMRSRIGSVGNTKKITSAMKLVAAAKVRRAQAAVLGGRPFSENLVKVLYGVNQRLRVEDVDVPLTQVRPVKTVLLVCCTGDRGLCGGFNNFMIKKCESRVEELTAMGVETKLVLVGKKAVTYFNNINRRDQYNIVKNFDMGQAPSTKEAQVIADEIFSEFVSEEADKVELLYTKFISLIKAEPIVQTLLPLSPEGEVCDINGNCVDAKNDEVFKLTSKDGEFAVERETTEVEVSEFDGSLIFEQDPVQILDAILPLYMNSQVLRALQESIASELAARMQAMTNATNNAKDLQKRLNLEYNRKRQAKITSEIIEICAGASA